MPSNPYILLVDDDPDDRLFFLAAFANQRPEIQIAVKTSGEEALEFLQHCFPDNIPELMVLDYEMPKMTGCDLVRHLAPIPAFASIPKVLWSHSNRYLAKCKGLDFAECIVKPGTTAEMDDLVTRFINLMQTMNNEG